MYRLRTLFLLLAVAPPLVAAAGMVSLGMTGEARLQAILIVLAAGLYGLFAYYAGFALACVMVAFLSPRGALRAFGDARCHHRGEMDEGEH
jgi:hypothetical protein